MRTINSIAKAMACSAFFILSGMSSDVFGSSHREVPLIANDPLADNTDMYAFRSPDDPNTVTIIANYIPTELPHGGPNYYSFGENIRYEIHIDNDAAIHGDEIIYRFTFQEMVAHIFGGRYQFHIYLPPGRDCGDTMVPGFW